MTRRLENMLLVLEDAAAERQIRLADPNREPDETTEDDVIVAMMRHKMPPIEIVRHKNRWTRALRIMLKGGLDQQR